MGTAEVDSALALALKYPVLTAAWCGAVFGVLLTQVVKKSWLRMGIVNISVDRYRATCVLLGFVNGTVCTAWTFKAFLPLEAHAIIGYVSVLAGAATLMIYGLVKSIARKWLPSFADWLGDNGTFKP